MSYLPEGTTPTRPVRSRPAGAVPFLLAALLLAAIGVATTTPIGGDWFRSGPTVPWSPAIVVVALVWTVLDLLNGLAGWLLWRARTERTDARAAFAVWSAQYALQVLWLLAFMAQTLVAGRLLWVVFVLLLLLDLATAVAVLTGWRVSRPAGVLLLAVLVWLLYGSALSWAATALRILNGL